MFLSPECYLAVKNIRNVTIKMLKNIITIQNMRIV